MQRKATDVISVLIVEDSVVVRRLIVDALTSEPGIQVVGTAADGRIGLNKIAQLKPDVVTLDIEMPVLDGLAALRELRQTNARLPVIMFSTLTERGAAATLDALAAGASDYVTKPANVGSVAASVQAIRRELVPRIHALVGRGTSAPRGTAPPGSTRSAGVAVSSAATAPTIRPPGVRPVAPPRSAPAAAVKAIAVGSSTGGPDALARILTQLPATLPVPVFIVQHMPPLFTRMFADRLNRQSQVEVVEAEDGMPVRPGVVHIAPGDRHMVVVRAGAGVVIRLNDAPPENSCRPAVDVLFRSVARIYGRSTLAVVLTGMGHDGRRGSEELRAAGAEIVAQDEASSVVWGMPGAVVNAGLADRVLPLGEVSRYIATRATSNLTRTAVLA
jgi:two-component system chemotaxis response regulator CheB